ncbi:MAG: hypothetical protein ACF8TS_07830 [Maioricimonas sp. JB049]
MTGMLSRSRRLVTGLVLLAGIMALLPGCSQFVLLGLLLGGPPTVEPDFDSETGLSLKGKDITVAVVCYAPTELKWNFPKIDAEVSSAVAYRLAEHGINVIHPDYIRAWVDENSDWERADEIGRAFKADFVIELELASFGLYEENSTTLFRGRTEAYVNVFEMDEVGAGERIFTKEIDFAFPTRVPRSTYDQTPISFKREYLSRLSEKIGFLFYERFSGDMMPWAS